MNDYDYVNYSNGLRDPRDYYQPKGISRGDTVLLGIVLGVAGAAALAGVGSADSLTNEIAGAAVALVSLAGAGACFLSVLGRHGAAEQEIETLATVPAGLKPVSNRANGLDIFNVRW